VLSLLLCDRCSDLIGIEVVGVLAVVHPLVLEGVVVSEWLGV